MTRQNWIALAQVIGTCVVLVGMHAMSRAPGVRETLWGRLLNDAANNGPNQTELDIITKNYYEQLVDVDRSPEWLFGGAELRQRVKDLLGLKGGGGARKMGAHTNWESIAVYGAVEELPTGFLEHRLKPNITVLHKNVEVRTNRWGHRDDDNYDKRKPEGVFRIALCGSSNSLGSGCPREDVFEHLVEIRLNEELAGQAWDRYEVINFSVERYHLLERVYVCEEIAPEFEPDLILLAVNMRDLRRALYERLIHRVKEGRDLHFAFLEDIVARAGLTPDQSFTKMEQRLQRYIHEIAAAALHDLKVFSERSGIPVALLVLRLETDGVNENHEWLARAGEIAGLTVLRVYDAYEGQKPADVYLVPGEDYHPTAYAHHLLADEIYDEMLSNAVVARLLLKQEEVPDAR